MCHLKRIYMENKNIFDIFTWFFTLPSPNPNLMPPPTLKINVPSWPHELDKFILAVGEGHNPPFGEIGSPETNHFRPRKRGGLSQQERRNQVHQASIFRKYSSVSGEGTKKLMRFWMNAEEIFRKSWTCWTLLQGDFWEVSSSSWIVQMPSSRKAVKNAKSWSKRRHLPRENP